MPDSLGRGLVLIGVLPLFPATLFARRRPRIIGLMTFVNNCPICGRLQDLETSYSKYLAPQYDRSLPEAAGRLSILPDPAGGDPEKHHTRRCPECGTLYDYVCYYEYYANGGEDNEELRRMNPAETAAFILSRARSLERLRRDINTLEDAAGRLGSFIDRGRTQAEEIRESLAEMETLRRQADSQRLLLKEIVEALRRVCPEILTAWAGANARVCRKFLDAPGDGGEDGHMARFEARSVLEAWEKLPAGGETYIAGNSPWLPEYDEHLDRELATPE